MKAALLILLVALPAQAMDRLAALSMIESGNQDHAVGPDREVSRWQMTPEIWRNHTSLPLSAATNPFTAQHVVELELNERTRAFVASHGRQPTDQEFYGLWHRPARSTQLKPRESERARRFANLCAKP